jgi:hypothetical protein
MGDLFEGGGRHVKSFRQILRLRGQQVDPVHQQRVRMEQARIIQDCNRLIEMPVLRFELREVQ